MRVQDIMTEKFETILSTDSLTVAARKMKSLNVGILPVQDGTKLVGIVTDRDIVIRGLAENKDPGRSSVKEIMTSEVKFCSCEDSIEDAADIMEEKQIRRLIVVDSQNTPIGIVTLGDIAAKSHADQLSGEILEAVSEPCCPRI